MFAHLCLAAEPPVLRKRVKRQGAVAGPDGIGIGCAADQGLLFNTCTGKFGSHLMQAACIGAAGKFAPFGITQPETAAPLQDQIHLLVAVAPETEAAGRGGELQRATHISHHKRFPDGTEQR